MARLRAVVPTIIRHCEEAAGRRSNLSQVRKIDCFASLAMTTQLATDCIMQSESRGYGRECLMPRVRVAGFSISLDGFGAGPEQSLENPLGKRGLELHQWMFGTRMFRAMIGKDGGSDGVDEAYAHRSMDGFGAFILGRHMF